MTWEQLLLLLTSMKKADHSAMGDPVRVISDGERFDVELFENLVDGTLAMIPHFNDAEDSDAD